MIEISSTQQYQPIKIQTLGTVMGKPLGTTNPVYGAMPIFKTQEPPPLEMPGQGLSRAVNYYADYAGCWRWCRLCRWRNPWAGQAP